MTRPWNLDDALHLSSVGFSDAQIAHYYGIKAADCGYRLACGMRARAMNRETGAMVERKCAECHKPTKIRRGLIWGDCCRRTVMDREHALI